MFGMIGALWGLGGVALLLAYAIVSLTPPTLESFEFSWQWHHWAALLLNLVFMAYYEGYKGFQKGFSPRVAARARHLRSNPYWLHVLLGPFFCAGFLHATTRRKISVILLTTFIFILVLLVSQLQQPWRGIVDASVLLGLAWGLLSVIIYGVIALTAQEFDYEADLPGES